jgi:hypothetical protein
VKFHRRLDGEDECAQRAIASGSHRSPVGLGPNTEEDTNSSAVRRRGAGTKRKIRGDRDDEPTGSLLEGGVQFDSDKEGDIGKNESGMYTLVWLSVSDPPPLLSR